jgi:para-aminobenzoate synthetase/4-amino-4-deoxychorismate lyase
MTSQKTFVRFDDLRRRPATAWEFKGLSRELRANTLNEVRATIEAAEAAAADGAWVVGLVAYEAAPAFDRHLVVNPPEQNTTSFPLAWFGLFDRRDDATPLDSLPAPSPAGPSLLRRSPGALAFCEAVEDIRARIAAGDVYQVNLTEEVVGRSDGAPFDLYLKMTRAQRSGYGAFIDVGDSLAGHIVVSASPELFFRWDDHGITARPMKGTAPRHPDLATDRRVANRLTTSSKERAENVMIVDLLRNDLSRIALPGGVVVEDLLALERYETVWQLTSTVNAKPRPDVSVADVFAAMFPCGSVTGAPKVAAMEVITELERRPRGVYCGAIGYLGPPTQSTRAVFSVPIRTALVDRVMGTFSYGVGAGITWPSSPAAENAELESKCRVLTDDHPPFSLLETMRCDRDGIANLERHMGRLSQSAEWFAFPLDIEALVAALAALPARTEPMRLRVLVERDGGFHIECIPLNDAPSEVTLAIDCACMRSDDVFCLHKTTNRAHYEAARQRHPQVDDVVLTNERGEITETTIANIAMRIDDKWWTPPLKSGCLPGIGRQVRVDAGELLERVLWPRDLLAADEIAIVNDLRGWRPARLAPP